MINEMTNEEIAIAFANKKLEKVNSILSEDYKNGFEEGIEKYLDSINLENDIYKQA